MKIIIAGAGEVGTHLAKLLSHEEQDIILIDDDEKKLDYLDSNYNLMTVLGSPTSFKAMKEAGVGDADLFVAVTPHESRNIHACTMAANLGAKKTVARIDNHEYLMPENRDFFKQHGIDELIYPEMLAAKEIVASLKRTWTRQWFELCNGELILVGTKIRSNALITNQKLNELTRDNSSFHIAAIRRKEVTIIPRGNDSIREDDIVYFTTTPEYIKTIRILTGKEDTAVKKVLIVGGSRIAERTIDYLPDYMKVTLIEQDQEKSYRLAERLNGPMVIHGDGRSLDLLKEEGIADTDAFISLTDSSEVNILSCLTAKRFGVAKSVAEVENLSYVSTAENLNIGTIINKKLLAAGRIYQMLLDEDTTNTKCLSLADAEVLEMVAKPDSKITRAAVRDLDLPKGLTIGGLSRNGKGIIVTGDTQIQANDHVLVFCLDTALRKLEKLFN